MKLLLPTLLFCGLACAQTPVTQEPKPAPVPAPKVEPVPSKVEPAKQDPTKQDPAKTDPTKQPPKTETPKTDKPKEGDEGRIDRPPRTSRSRAAPTPLT